MRTKEQIYEIAVKNGLYWLKEYLNGNNTKKAIIELEMAACICAELDRGCKKPTTEKLQKFVWTRGYIVGNCTQTDYENSGYFDENYLKKLLTKLQKCGIIITEVKEKR